MGNSEYFLVLIQTQAMYLFFFIPILLQMLILMMFLMNIHTYKKADLHFINFWSSIDFFKCYAIRCSFIALSKSFLPLSFFYHGEYKVSSKFFIFLHNDNNKKSLKYPSLIQTAYYFFLFQTEAVFLTEGHWPWSLLEQRHQYFIKAHFLDLSSRSGINIKTHMRHYYR